MNAFQILNKEGNPIPINDLDREVCELTGNEYDPKHYCVLGNRKDHKSDLDFMINTHNWYDTIGYQISQGMSFEDIYENWIKTMSDFIGQLDENGEVITVETCVPYHTKVLKSWIEKGYKGKQIIE